MAKPCLVPHHDAEQVPAMCRLGNFETVARVLGEAGLHRVPGSLGPARTWRCRTKVVDLPIIDDINFSQKGYVEPLATSHSWATLLIDTRPRPNIC
jgi:hypothetical protein